MRSIQAEYGDLLHNLSEEDTQNLEIIRSHFVDNIVEFWYNKDRIDLRGNFYVNQSSINHGIDDVGWQMGRRYAHVERNKLPRLLGMDLRTIDKYVTQNPFLNYKKKDGPNISWSLNLPALYNRDILMLAELLEEGPLLKNVPYSRICRMLNVPPSMIGELVKIGPQDQLLEFDPADYELWGLDRNSVYELVDYFHKAIPTPFPYSTDQARVVLKSSILRGFSLEDLDALGRIREGSLPFVLYGQSIGLTQRLYKDKLVPLDEAARMVNLFSHNVPDLVKILFGSDDKSNVLGDPKLKLDLVLELMDFFRYGNLPPQVLDIESPISYPKVQLTNDLNNIDENPDVEDDELELPPEDFIIALVEGLFDYDLFDPLKDDSESSNISYLEHILSDCEQSDPESLYIEHEMYSRLRQAMDTCLNERERSVIHHYYGFDCVPCDFREIGSILNLSGSRIQQIERDAVRKLRKSSVLKYNSFNENSEPYFPPQKRLPEEPLIERSCDDYDAHIQRVFKVTEKPRPINQVLDDLIKLFEE